MAKEAGLTKEEADKFFPLYFELIEEKNALLEKEYFEKCKAIIPPSKIFKVLHAEIKFNRNMLKILHSSEEDKK